MPKNDHPMSIRIPTERYERLRAEAFNRRMHISDIINEALEEHERKQDAQDDIPDAHMPGMQADAGDAIRHPEGEG